MCGIAGIFNFNNTSAVELDVLKKMAYLIKHRGPDDEGFFISDDKKLGFAHRRLSIIDLASGSQPMWDFNNSICIVFNGEIYNFIEIKYNLIKKGYQFKTNSDTEVILNLYLEYGEEGFEKLNGIFAFAIYNKKSKTLVIARDHIGVKPLYYTIISGIFIFGSEIKTIIQHPLFKKELDLTALNSLLTFRYNPAPQTLFKNIKTSPCAALMPWA